MMMPADDTDVLYVGFLTGHGGDANQLFLLAEGMHRRGAKVKVIVPALETSIGLATRLRDLGITCERSDLIHADMMGRRQNAISMLRLARQLNAPTVHFFTGNSCLPRSILTALGVVGAPRSFVTVQSPYETVNRGSLQARWWTLGVRHKFHVVISPSDHGSAFQRNLGVRSDQAVTIRNSIDVAAVSAGNPAGPRTELGVSDEAPLIVFTSRIDPQKRPVDAVRIFARVVEAHPDAVLVFVGTGSESDRVRSCASELGVSDSVELVGHRNDVADWLAASTAWILPTERENFSVAVLEALAAGCVVLSTPCRGNDEVLVDGDNALLFGIGDIEAGAAALGRALKDVTLRRRLSRGARADRRFTVERMIDEHVRLYERFCTLSLPSKEHEESISNDSE